MPGELLELSECGQLGEQFAQRTGRSRQLRRDFDRDQRPAEVRDGGVDPFGPVGEMERLSVEVGGVDAECSGGGCDERGCGDFVAGFDLGDV
ncbi:hypothetical protein [Actinocorallia populi]|uniref:hypothetical protein n=1 Tax=Actinocorallia populi TaxID=2079200 RepID=UPI001E39E366|nr:hypothetical protein [Actinocorallia populi]